MLEGLAMLLASSTLMAIASFGTGLLPLTLSLSQSRLRFLSTLGMGVLVGTALIVIIPEGVETLYSSTSHVDHIHNRRELVSPNADLQWFNMPIISFTKRTVGVEGLISLPAPLLPDDLSTGQPESEAPPRTPTEPGIVHAVGSSMTTEGNPSSEPVSHEPHAWIGISLISGFILMYLIDTLPSVKSHTPVSRNNIYSLSDLSSNTPPTPIRQRSSASFSTTLGLVIHAAADGIALGASSTIPSISFVVFFAIIIHKAPAAFGLTSVLLKQGLGKRQVKTHLMAFSLAAPIGAIITWTLIRTLGGAAETTHPESMKFWTGVVLIFSGGTFLYVAMHTMQELDSASTNNEPQGNGYLDPVERLEGTRPPKNLQLICTSVIGMLLPLLAQIGHAH